jgi:hypothetical protein
MRLAGVREPKICPKGAIAIEKDNVPQNMKLININQP